LLFKITGFAAEPSAEFSFAALEPPPMRRPGHCQLSYEWPAVIAGLYEQGDVLPRNLIKAGRAYEIAATETNVDPSGKDFVAIQYKLGTLYLNGKRDQSRLHKSVFLGRCCCTEE
jgi:hypothetical protein